jgi:putative endonuclease
MYVYILANGSRTLYVGVTSNLKLRVLQHRNGESKFTRRYGLRRLVYYERVGPAIAALAREHQIKRYDRAKRVALVRSKNPRWDDLAESWFTFPFGTPEGMSKRRRDRAKEAKTRKLKGLRRHT